MSAHTFPVSDEQYAKFKEWEKEQEAIAKAVYAKKKKLGYWVPREDSWGGQYDWVFSQSSGIGLSLRVVNKVTGDELNLTELDKW